MFQSGGLSGFMHSFVAEVMAICRAHVAALGGNTLVAYQMSECVLDDHLHKNQVQWLIPPTPVSVSRLKILRFVETELLKIILFVGILLLKTALSRYWYAKDLLWLYNEVIILYYIYNVNTQILYFLPLSPLRLEGYCLRLGGRQASSGTL